MRSASRQPDDMQLRQTAHAVEVVRSLRLSGDLR
jgi:hypothetical protein